VRVGQIGDAYGGTSHGAPAAPSLIAPTTRRGTTGPFSVDVRRAWITRAAGDYQDASA
jgi:hypothetical protein